MRTVLHPDQIRALAHAREVQDDLRREAETVAVRAAQRAPKATGAGAASIHAEPVIVDGAPSYGVSWDPAHDYMRFAEFGTEHEPARPFLRPAATQ